MAAPGRYDTSLQMFVEEGRAPDMQRLRFLRWLAERGWLEHAVVGAPSGELSALPTPDGNGRS
jgi:hypothetical protein